MQNFMESNIETTIRKYCTEVDRPSTGNRNMIVSFYSHKLIDGIHICQELLLIGEHMSCGTTVEEYSSGRK